MKPTAIVYTLSTGHTRKYALLLGEQIELPAFSLEEANSRLPCGSPALSGLDPRKPCQRLFQSRKAVFPPRCLRRWSV